MLKRSPTSRCSCHYAPVGGSVARNYRGAVAHVCDVRASVLWRDVQTNLKVDSNGLRTVERVDPTFVFPRFALWLTALLVLKVRFMSRLVVFVPVELRSFSFGNSGNVTAHKFVNLRYSAVLAQLAYQLTTSSGSCCLACSTATTTTTAFLIIIDLLYFLSK